MMAKADKLLSLIINSLYQHLFTNLVRTLSSNLHVRCRRHSVERISLPLQKSVNNCCWLLATWGQVWVHISCNRTCQHCKHGDHIWVFSLIGFHLAHYNDVTMGSMASHITSLLIVYSAVYSGADERKHQSSASLAFERGIQRGPVNSPHKWPVKRKMFPFDDVIMVWFDFIQLSKLLAVHIPTHNSRYLLLMFLNIDYLFLAILIINTTLYN